MLEVIQIYWAETLAVLSVVFGTVAAAHAAMTKREVRSALGWVGVIILSPLVGAMIYAVAGINRIRRATLISRRALELDEIWRSLSLYAISRETVATQFGPRFGQMKLLGDKVSRHPLSSGNLITMLTTGEETFDAMCEAIEAAQFSIILETYIFDRDVVGRRVADCLIAAHKRGVAVRVIIDAVGARYSVPSIIGYLEEGGVPVAVFNGQVIMGLRLPYANLRTHRKILVVDGATAFVGGMNIRAGFVGADGARDTHFRVTGPVVADILAVAAEDWHFETGEVLLGPEWRVRLDDALPGAGTAIRAVVSGPDTHIETRSPASARRLLGRRTVDPDRFALLPAGYHLYRRAEHGRTAWCAGRCDRAVAKQSRHCRPRHDGAVRPDPSGWVSCPSVERPFRSFEADGHRPTVVFHRFVQSRFAFIAAEFRDRSRSL